MKKILLTMIGICLIMGMQAQTTKRLREYRNPQIDGLMKYAKSMGVDVWEFYSRNYRSMSFHVSEYNDSDPHGHPALLIDSIKSTFLGLADQATDKYLWEKDREGRDSVYYTLTLGKYSNARKIMDSEMGKQTEFHYPAPEILTYKYEPYKRENVREGQRVSIGSADLHYQFYPDSIVRKIEQVEMDELMEATGKVLKKEKVKYHTLQVEMDSAYNWRNRDEILEYGGAVQGEACETTIRVYDAQPKDRAQELMEEVRQAVWEFIDQHPNCDYYIDMQEAFNRRWSSPIRVENMYKDIREQFLIRITYVEDLDAYSFFLITSKGGVAIPTSWENLKSWKNGAKVYRK